MQTKIISSLIFSSTFKRVLVVLRPHSPSWKLLIIILNVEARFSAVFLTSVHTIWIDGLFYKLFTELGINGRLWLVLKDLYTNVNAEVLFSGRLSRSFSISQGTRQGRILAPFTYKVCINSLLNELFEHNFAICISGMKLSAPSFADDISLLVLYPTFLQHFMNIAYECNLKWRHEFNNIKSGIVTYGESQPSHLANMQEKSWTLGVENVDELYEYKKLGVYKNYCGSFNANIDEHFEKNLVIKRKLSSQPTSISARLTLSFMSSVGNKSVYPLSYLVPRFSLSLRLY